MITNPNPSYSYSAVETKTAAPRTELRDMYSPRWTTPEYRNPPLVLADGTQVSVQGGWKFYSSPQEDSNKWTCISYSEVEVGCLTTSESGRTHLTPADWAGLNPYEEHGFNVNKPVYSWVPIKVIQEYILLHGGIIEGVLPGWYPH